MQPLLRSCHRGSRGLGPSAAARAQPCRFGIPGGSAERAPQQLQAGRHGSGICATLCLLCHVAAWRNGSSSSSLAAGLRRRSCCSIRHCLLNSWAVQLDRRRETVARSSSSSTRERHETGQHWGQLAGWGSFCQGGAASHQRQAVPQLLYCQLYRLCHITVQRILATQSLCPRRRILLPHSRLGRTGSGLLGVRTTAQVVARAGSEWAGKAAAQAHACALHALYVQQAHMRGKTAACLSCDKVPSTRGTEPKLAVNRATSSRSCSPVASGAGAIVSQQDIPTPSSASTQRDQGSGR